MGDRLTAREAAEFAKAKRLSLPHSQQGIDKWLREQNYYKSPACHERPSNGGRPAYEYDIHVFGDRFVGAFYAERSLEKEQRSHAVQVKRSDAIIAQLSVFMLDQRQREVMAARAAILNALLARKWFADETLSQSINWFERQFKALDVDRHVMARNGQLLTPDTDGVIVRLSPDAPHESNDSSAFDPSGNRRLTDDARTKFLPSKLIELANDRRIGQVTISRRTLYSWYQAAYETIPNTYTPAGLAPRKTKIKSSPNETVWWAGFMEHYARPTKPSIKLALKWYAKTLPDGQKPPTYKQVKTALAKLNEYEKFVGREGYLTLRNRLSYITRSTENLFPTTIYTADGKTFDAEVEHPFTKEAFRPEITSILDVATRKCVGFAISLKENVIAVTEALGKAAIGHGIPAIFYTDRGPGYKNKAVDADVTGLMARLGITKMHSLPYNSQARGSIERFHAIWNDLAREYPTYVGVDMDKEARKAAYEKTRQDIRIYKESRLLVKWDAFRERCQEVIDEYNNTPHSYLPKITDPKTGRTRHATPNEFWQTHVDNNNGEWDLVEVEPDMVDDIFRPYEIRKVRRGIVQWNNNEYYHQALDREWHEKRVIVAFDIDDASKVWVRALDEDVDGNPAPGHLICVAINSGNKRDFVPQSYQEKAQEDRVKTKLKRIERKRQSAEAELNPGRFIDHQPGNVVPFRFPDNEIEGEAIEVELPEPVVEQVEASTQTPTRPKFRNEIELALFAEKQGLEKLTESQRSVLRSFLNSHTDRETLRLHGVNLKLLEEMFRSAA